MTVTERIESRIAPTLGDMGFEVVRVLLMGTTRPVLQIMAERADGTGMNVDDCAALSRAISALMDVDDPIEGTYTLEVSSPGIDRPLTRLKDFDRFAGFEAKIEMDHQVDGRRRFAGELAGIVGETVRITVDGNMVELPYSGIRKAKLRLNDAFLEAAGATEGQQVV